VNPAEPGSLAEVGTLARGLEEEPLELLVLVILRAGTEFALRIILVGEIGKDGVRLPEYEVVVGVVDDCRDTTVRVEVNMWGRLLLLLAKVQVDRFIRQAELGQEVRDLPPVGSALTSKTRLAENGDGMGWYSIHCGCIE